MHDHEKVVPSSSAAVDGSVYQLPIRRPAFDFDDTIPRHWYQDNPVMTHGFNAFNLTFPAIERFFVRSLIRSRHCVSDPGLKQQIKGFCGQEAMHAQAHEHYFMLLRRQGYRIDTFLKWYEYYLTWSERHSSPALNLAATAAAEHYTATFARMILTEPFLLQQVHPVMRRLLVWHAAEEIEHKAVAFDTMQAAGISYAMRIGAFLVASLEILFWSTAGIVMLLWQDRVSPWKIYTEKRRFRNGAGDIPKQLRRAISAYFRRDFHPGQIPELEYAYAGLVREGIVAEADTATATVKPAQPG